jgi:NADH-quinone oxidoreductase subunit G
VELGCGDVTSIRRELGSLSVSAAASAVIRLSPPRVSAGHSHIPSAGEAVLASWHQLIDRGSLLDGDEALAGTAHPAKALLSKATAAAAGVADGDLVTIGATGGGDGTAGAVTLPCEVAEMPDKVVWVPTRSPGSEVGRTLGVTSGAVVTVSAHAGGA